MWPDLSRRQHQAELMDDPALDAAKHRHALRGLERVNWISRSAAILWPELRALATTDRQKTWRVLDIASGGGDVAIALARRAWADRISLEIEGVDVSPTAIVHAQENANHAGVGNVSFKQLDVLGSPLPGEYDVVMCSLFLHHLCDSHALELLAKMAQLAQRLVLVNDLRRTQLGYALAWWGGRLISRSPIVHVDGPLSVAAAFTTAEALAMAGQAGLAGATIAHRWPQRFLLRWERR